MKLLTTALAASAVLLSATNAQTDTENLSDVKQAFEAYMSNNYKNCNDGTAPAAAAVAQCSGAYSWEEARAVSKCIIENEALDTNVPTLPTDTSDVAGAMPTLMTLLPMLQQKATQDKLFTLLKNDLIPNAVDLLACFITIDDALVATFKDLLAGAALDRQVFDALIQQLLASATQGNPARRLLAGERSLLGNCPAQLVMNDDGYAAAFPLEAISQSFEQKECACDAFAYVAPPAGQKYIDQLIVDFLADNKANLEKFIRDASALANSVVDFVQGDNTANQAICQTDARRLQAGKKTLQECIQPLLQENSETMKLMKAFMLDGLDDKCAGVEFCDPSAFPFASEERYGAAKLQALMSFNMNVVNQAMDTVGAVSDPCNVKPVSSSASTTALSVVALAVSALTAVGTMH